MIRAKSLIVKHCAKHVHSSCSKQLCHVSRTTCAQPTCIFACSQEKFGSFEKLLVTLPASFSTVPRGSNESFLLRVHKLNTILSNRVTSRARIPNISKLFYLYKWFIWFYGLIAWKYLKKEKEKYFYVSLMSQFILLSTISSILSYYSFVWIYIYRSRLSHPEKRIIIIIHPLLLTAIKSNDTRAKFLVGN